MKSGSISGVWGASRWRPAARLPNEPFTRLPIWTTPRSPAASERCIGWSTVQWRLMRDEFAQSTWTAFWRTTVDDVAAADVAEELGP